MTDRIRQLTLILDRDYRGDDAAAIIAAIRMIKGVVDVKPTVVTSDDHVARMVVRSELRSSIYKAIAQVFGDEL